MDLSVLHPVKSLDRDYTWKDKLNNVTSPFGCRFLEWTGWYNQDIYQRLLGHYRLYHVFKTSNRSINQVSLPLSYIATYRTFHFIKYFFSYITAILYYCSTFGGRYYLVAVEGINKLLLNDRCNILQTFLTHASSNFEEALLNAVRQLNEPEKPVNQTAIIIQNRHEYNTYNNSSQYFNEYNTTVQPVTTGIKGKEKGVFSKKQVLILFDLLASNTDLECIDFTKLNKLEAIAEMLQAITGKGKETWIEELHTYKNRTLYDYNSNSELKQLVSIMVNLSQILNKGGYRKLAKANDLKIRELEKKISNS